MRVQHRSVEKTFKLNAWQGTLGNSTSIFKRNRLDSDLGPMLEYIFTELEGSIFARAKRDLFSLVNIYCPITQMSVGYCEHPPKDVLKPDAAIALTFSLVGRPLRKTPNDVFVNNISDYSSYWGKDVTHLTDYFVVNLRVSDLSKWYIKDYKSVNSLLYLYNVVGCTTKCFMENEASWFNIVGQHYPLSTLNNVDIIKDKYLTKSMANIFKTVPPNLWIYCREIWNNASNVFLPKMYNTDIGLYYVLHLRNVIGDSPVKRNVDFVKYQINQFVAKGIRELYSILRSGATPDTISDNLYAALHLFEELIEPGGLGHSDNPRAETMLIIANMRVKDNPQLSSALSVALSDPQLAATKLLRLPGSLEDFAEVLFK